MMSAAPMCCQLFLSAELHPTNAGPHGAGQAGCQMLRIFFAVIVVALVALPAILICLNDRLATPFRLFLASLAFLAPLLLIWAIHLVPAFDGQAPDNPAFWRSIGVLLSMTTLTVPWLIYAGVKGRSTT